MKKEQKVRIHPSWYAQLEEEFDKPYFEKLRIFLKEEKQKHVIYPPGPKIFAAFDHTPFEEVKVVILGQDPYHGPGQANGLCFSVSPGIPPPPSLKNIFKEIHNDTGAPVPRSGDLSPWTGEGVLLLNAILTVRKSQPGSHRNRGWEEFTNAAIKKLSGEREKLIFMLWGSFARQKAELIDPSKHYILTAAHPSPFSYDRGFKNCGHFSKANAILLENGLKPVNWALNGE